MFRRYGFIIALALCLCVFAYDTISIMDDWGGGAIAWADVVLNETNFPDEVLRAILKDALKKNDNETITASEIENLTYLDCSDATNRFYSSGTKKYLQNLKGLVDNFTQLQRLNLSKNEKLNNPDLLTGAIYNLISLDVSECKAMSTLNLMTSVSNEL